MTPPSAQRPHYDHVTRILQRHYSVEDGELRVGGQAVSTLIQQFGSPLYLYDQAVISATIDRLRSVLPARFELFYSIKANPSAAILQCCLKNGCGLEVASAGELVQALRAGGEPDRLIFAGPGKREAELRSAIESGIREIHVESVEEARVINAIAEGFHRQVSIALRINPIAGAGGAMRMGGKPSPFGIDEEALDSAIEHIASLPRIRIDGVHLFMGTQILDASILLQQYRHAVAIARRVSEAISNPLRSLDLGGGLGTPYFSHEKELDLNELGESLAEIDRLLQREPQLENINCLLEPGRFLINEAGVYLTRVLRVKHSRGKTFVITDGGMHHHLAASGNLGQTIKRNYPIAIANKLHREPTQHVDIVGPLCTPLDTLARQIAVPDVEPGDLVAVFQSGAYSRTASPLGFLSHPAPAEILVAGGTATLIRRAGQTTDLWQDQPCFADDTGAITAE